VLAETLGLATLPDEKLVTALLRACGYTPAQTGQWLAVRARLAGLASGPSVSGPSVSGPSASGQSASGPAGDRGAGMGEPHDHQAPASVSGSASAEAALNEVTALTSTLAASRARHSLRLPGRGSLRAPGSRLRTLALAAAAVVVGIGGIAVFVALADSDGGDAGVPVYAPGAVRTAAPQPSETPAAQEVAGTPSPAPSAGRSAAPTATPTTPAAPPAQAGVWRTGTATLQSGQSLDLDGGGSDPDIIAFDDGAGIRADPSSRHFAPEPTATKQACAAADGYQKTMQDLAAGNGVCVRTDKGRYAHITVTRTAPLAFSYVVWS
jgi:hypothetical protein